MDTKYKSLIFIFLLQLTYAVEPVSFKEYFFSSENSIRTGVYAGVLGLCAFIWHKGFQQNPKDYTEYYLFARNQEEYEHLKSLFTCWQQEHFSGECSILGVFHPLNFIVSFIFKSCCHRAHSLDGFNTLIYNSGFKALTPVELNNRIQVLYEKDKTLVEEKNKTRTTNKLMPYLYNVKNISPYLYVKKLQKGNR